MELPGCKKWHFDDLFKNSKDIASGTMQQVLRVTEHSVGVRKGVREEVGFLN